MNMTFVRKMVVSALLCAAFLSASATEYTFPSAGGDLASESAWGRPLPTSSDIAKIDKSGTYTLSDDVTFTRLAVATDGAVFNFGSRKMTLSASSAAGLSVSSAGARTVFNGGMLDFSSTAHWYPLSANSDMTTVFTNGCIVTNVAAMHAMRNTYRSKVEIAGGSKAYVKELRVLNDPGANDVLEIYDGGQLHVSERIYAEANGTTGNYGGVVLRVRGAGSLFKYTGSNDAALGFQRNCNTFHAVDGGAIDFSGASGSLLLGGWNSSNVRTNNALVVERSATANIPKLQSNSDRNRIFVGSGATLTTGKLRLNSSMNEIIISNATFTSTAPRNSTQASQEGFNLAMSSACTGNVFRIIGPGASIGMLPWPLYWFNSASYITVSLEGGAKWGDADTHFDAFFSKEQHCTFRVTGAGTVYGDAEGKSNRIYLCDKNHDVTAACASNVVEVSDGATLYAAGVYLAGVDNALVVSNGTVDVKYLVPGFLYSASSIATNGMVRFCGTSPKVYVRGGSYCKIENNSILRFEIPKAGYADDHVPLDLSCPLTFDDTSRLEIDCEEFARDTYGTLTLIRSTSDISSEVSERLLANVSGLPPRSSLVISGKTVKLHCPRVGSIIMVY